MRKLVFMNKMRGLFGLQDDVNLPWILLRGLGREKRHWGDFDKHLSEGLSTFGSVNVHALDLPGVGEHRHIRSPTKIEGIVEFLRTKTEPIPRPCHVMGLSLGGLVALGWACMYPDDIGRIVVINASTADCPFYNRLRFKAVFSLVRVALAQTAQDKERGVLNLVTNQRPLNRDLLNHWTHVAETAPVTIRTVLAQLLAAKDFSLTKDLPSIKALVLASQNDRLADVRCSQQIARRLNAPIAIHPQAGHDLPSEDPQWLIKQVTTWLES